MPEQTLLHYSCRLLRGCCRQLHRLGNQSPELPQASQMSVQCCTQIMTDTLMIWAGACQASLHLREPMRAQL